MDIHIYLLGHYRLQTHLERCKLITCLISENVDQSLMVVVMTGSQNDLNDIISRRESLLSTHIAISHLGNELTLTMDGTQEEVFYSLLQLFPTMRFIHESSHYGSLNFAALAAGADLGSKATCYSYDGQWQARKHMFALVGDPVPITHSQNTGYNDPLPPTLPENKLMQITTPEGKHTFYQLHSGQIVDITIGLLINGQEPTIQIHRSALPNFMVKKPHSHLMV